MLEPLPEPILSVRDLRVSFDDVSGRVRALDGVSLDIRPGRTLGVVGESGCGKSVTARAILRILDKNAHIEGARMMLSTPEGEVDLAALAPNSRQMRRIRGHHIGLVFQEPMTSFSPAHTIGAQIVETIRLHRRMSRSEAREQAIAQLQRVGTPHPGALLDQFAWQLSGGLRQRAMIAMALVCGPRILIADEPTTALDVTTQAQVLELLQSLQRQSGLGLMLITHDLGVIAETADDVLVMYLGAVVEQAPVDRIFHAPQHPYTRALLRSMPDVLAEPRTRLRTLTGAVPHPQVRPDGCPFHTRCPDTVPGLCDRQAPAAVEVEPGHLVRCHLVAPATLSATADEAAP